MAEKITVRRSASGMTTVTVAIKDGDTTVSWTVKQYGGTAAAMRSARAGAQKALNEIREA